MKCPHIMECEQEVSKITFKACCLKGRIEKLHWDQKDCFKYGEMKTVTQMKPTKKPREWEAKK